MENSETGLPETWAAPTLADVCDILDSMRVPVNNAERTKRIAGRPNDELYPYYGATGQVGVIDNYIFDGEHVLLGEDGAPFLDAFKEKAYVANGKFWVNNHAHILRAAISNEYLAHFLNQIDYSNHVTGTTRLKLTQGALKSIPVHFAPEREQRRIVAKIEELFSELDKGADSLETARKQLKAYRQAVLKQAFEGKLTAQWREENKDKLETAEQLLARIKREREAHYREQLAEWKQAVKDWEATGKHGRKPATPSEPTDLKHISSGQLPLPPDGWAWVRYGDLCSVVRNGISKKPEGTKGAKIFRISAVRPMEFDLNDVRYIDGPDDTFSDYYLESGDLVFTRYNGSRAYVGVCAEYRSDGRHLYPDKLIRTRLGVPSVLPSYIEKAANCGASRAFIESRIRTTAGQSGVSGSDIKSMPVPLCSPAEQSRITDHLDQELSNISKLIADIEVNLTRADALRQSILKRAFSGKLVAQDPSDEPASALLERVKADKAGQLSNSKKKRKDGA